MDKSLEERLRSLEERNRRVELDKRWETSDRRRASLVGLTYLVMVVFMGFIRVGDPFVSALVPTLGFFLSTLTMGWLKRVWLKSQS
jgi:hypothetical protein